MVISGILAAAAPQQVEAAKVAIKAHEWADVHQETGDGRMVLTIEAESTDEAMDRLLLLQKLPELLMAEMVEHWFEEEGEMRPMPTGELGEAMLNRPIEPADFIKKRGKNKK